MYPIIVWFRQDLRIEDNPALYHAQETGYPVIPLYILDTTDKDPWPIGSAQRWWLHQSLESLSQDLAVYRVPLILRRGNPKNILNRIIHETSAKAIYWNDCYEPFASKRDKIIAEHFIERNLSIKTFNAGLLFEPGLIKNKKGEFFKVFSPFWRTCLNAPAPLCPYPKPVLKPLGLTVKSLKLEALNLYSLSPNWSLKFKNIWKVSESQAHFHLENLADQALKHYNIERDKPNAAGTSLLSPYLRFGQISPRQVWSRLKGELNTARFLSEIGWREFSYHLLHHFPELPSKPFRSTFLRFPWVQDQELLYAWQKGQTGYPIVDAGMRQLWQTGWMHNRVRMIAASFLTKHLLISWTQGAEWFWDTLVDADLASNSMNWQWIAGCGVDASPYFRIFNPVLQGERFDARGDYIRTWAPELKNLPAKFIHKPWQAPPELLRRADVKLGDTYPLPIVNHENARQMALMAYRSLRSL